MRWFLVSNFIRLKAGKFLKRFNLKYLGIDFKINMYKKYRVNS